MNTYAPLITFMILFHLSAHSQTQEPLILRWKTNNPGLSDSLSITIPTSPGFSGDYNYEVDWDNDGIYDESNITGDVSHTYDRSGIYAIRIKGQFPAIYFNNEGDKSKLINIDQWGDIVWKTFLNAFYGCDNLEYKTSDEPLIEATSMTSMFRGCSKFNGEIGSWDVSNITHMNRMFDGATNFNQDIGGWDVTNLKYMSYMFSDAASFDQEIGGWDVSNVINMQYVFLRATNFNQDIGDWDVSKVLYTVGMFSKASNFNQDIGDWDVSKVENMSAMFLEASSFNQDIGDWDVSSVTNMASMLWLASAFNQDIGNWDVSNVESMSNTFNQSGIRSNNYDNILIGWSALPALQPNVPLGASGMKYCYGQNARMELMYNGWTIEGDLQDCSETCDPGPVNITWVGMVSTNWTIIDNWDLDFVPTPCFRVIIPSGKNVIINAASSASIFSMEVANGADIEIENGGELECLVGN